MKPAATLSSVLWLILVSGCGERDAAEQSKVIDVTPDTTVIQTTEQEVNAALQNSKKALDEAIDTQSGEH